MILDHPYICGDIKGWEVEIGDDAERTAREVIADFDGWIETAEWENWQVQKIHDVIAAAIRAGGPR